MNFDEEITVDNMKIKTLESSDIGVAFLIEIEGKVIYHAGDLNWWHWDGDTETLSLIHIFMLQLINLSM